MVKKIGKYELGKTLGSGTFGKVKLAVDTSDPKRTNYAIKILDRKQIEKENMQEQLKNEIAIMKMLKHDHIVRMFEVIQSPQHIYIVLEIVTGGELFDRIVAAKRFDESTARRYFQQLVLGIYYCHTQGVAHRDLKPENLLLDANDRLKISDFGLSALNPVGQANKMLQTTCGTPNYVAPEVLKEQGYDGKITDIWSCGVILFVMLAGYLPFDDPTMNGLFVKIEQGQYRIPKSFSAPVKHLLSRLLTVDPKKRITLDEILVDPWFKVDLDLAEVERVKGTAKVQADQDVLKTGFQQAEVSTGEANKPNAAREFDLNAFELASKLIMGSLSPLISKDQTVRRNTQFVANGSADTVLERVEKMLLAKNAKPTRAKNTKALKGHVPTQKEGGVMQFVITFMPTVCNDLCLVEVRRARGDTLDFQQFYRTIVQDLADIVPESKRLDAIELDN